MSADLGVREACASVVREADHVIIDSEHLAAFAEVLSEQECTPPEWNRDLHFFDGTEKTLYYTVVLDALNFCFWSMPGIPRWSVAYRGSDYNGYWALAAALKRAFLEGVPLWEPEYLRDLGREELASVLRGTVEIPLFEERLAHVRELGAVLIRDFGGNCAALIEGARHDAGALVRTIVSHFSSFDDVAWYRGKRIPFYKRAQILVCDCAATFSDEGWGMFDNLDALTAFADYKIPQVLRNRGVLVYDSELAGIVDSRRLIAAGSPAEVEIRAATVRAVEMLREHLGTRGVSCTAAEIDGLLWHYGQETRPGDLPYHLTRTIYY
jgi:hypothetical protein